MATSVEQFETLSLQLIQESWAYAAKGQYDTETDANIRRVRVSAVTLMAALGEASNVPRPPTAQGG